MAPPVQEKHFARPRHGLLRNVLVKKILFFSLASLAILGFYIYTIVVMHRLWNDVEKVADTYASLYYVAISEVVNDMELNVIFEEVIKKSKIPVIITDGRDKPMVWKNVRWPSFFSNSVIASDDTSAKARRALAKQLENFKSNKPPRELYNPRTKKSFGFLYYGPSRFQRFLSWAPFVEIVIILLFVFIGAWGVRNIQTSEKTTMWVALAKETAHQLGTPISSLMGWIELMRLESQESGTGGVGADNQYGQILNEMERDIARLNKITTRFGQIGSIPELRQCDLNNLIRDGVNYFKNRLPHISKQIELKTKLDWIPTVMANRDLLEWVLENLIKNAIDAIVARSGTISISTKYVVEEKIVRILHEDNGKGLDKDEQKKAFQMGFTTKPRGWGIGLALAKRIIEEYHSGNIYIYKSQKGSGTVFAVELPVEEKSRRIAT